MSVCRVPRDPHCLPQKVILTPFLLSSLFLFLSLPPLFSPLPLSSTLLPSPFPSLSLLPVLTPPCLLPRPTASTTTGRGVMSISGLSYGVVRVEEPGSITSLTLQDVGLVMPGG